METSEELAEALSPGRGLVRAIRRQVALGRPASVGCHSWPSDQVINKNMGVGERLGQNDIGAYWFLSTTYVCWDTTIGRGPYSYKEGWS